MTSAYLLRGLWTQVADNLAVHLARVPDDLPRLDEPLWEGDFLVDGETRHEVAYGLRGLMIHTVVAACEVPLALIEGTGFEAVKAASAQLQGSSPSRLVSEFAERRQRLFDFLAQLDDEQAAKLVTTPFGARAVGEVLMMTALHAMHHKGQIMLAMRQLGARPTAVFTPGR